MPIQAISFLTQKGNNSSNLKKILRKCIFPLVCTTTMLCGSETNAQNKNNNREAKQDTLGIVNIKQNIVPINKHKTFNLSKCFNSSISGECDYMFGVGSPMSLAIGTNSMIAHDKTGSFINLFTGAILSSPSASGQKVSPVGIFVGEGFIPNTPLSVRGRIIDKYDGKNTFVLDMPTPRVTIPINKDKNSVMMLQPMIRHVYAQGDKSCQMYGCMVNNSFPLPVYLTSTKEKRESSRCNAYTEVLILYDPVTNTISVTGFAAIPFFFGK